MLPAPLARFIVEPEQAGRARSRSVTLQADSWPEVVSQLRQLFPLLAERVLTASGSLTTGFILVVNDEVVPASRHCAYEVADGDEIALISAMAGG